MHVANGDAQVANFDTYSTRASLADERAGKVAGQTVGGITSEAAGAWCSSMYSHVTARADLSAVGFAIESGQAVSSSQSIEWAKQGGTTCRSLHGMRCGACWMRRWQILGVRGRGTQCIECGRGLIWSVPSVHTAYMPRSRLGERDTSHTTQAGPTAQWRGSP